MEARPSPLEWHPAYDGRPELMDWLHDSDAAETYCVSLAETTVTLRRYTGIRMSSTGDLWVFPYAVDELGRCIAGAAAA